MAKSEEHEYTRLASRLTAAADGITNHAAQGLERDLRDAANIIGHGVEKPPMFGVPWLMSELTKIANEAQEPEIRSRLRRLLGEA